MNLPTPEQLRDALAENESLRLRIAEGVLRAGLQALAILDAQAEALLTALRQSEEKP